MNRIKSNTLLIVLIIIMPYMLSFAKSVEEPFINISPEELYQAILPERGYAITATTNVPRFQGNVILRLARKASMENPNGKPLSINYLAWNKAFLKATGLDLQSAPVFIQLAYHYQQNLIIEYRRDKILPELKSEKKPDFVIKVKVEWPDKPGTAHHYSFDDTLSVPKLRITNYRIITYYLFDFDGIMVYDNIKGLKGKPTTGLLGLLFKVIGEGRIVQSRIAISPDGIQISAAKAKKGPFKINSIVTVFPNGTMQKGIPKDRKDLQVIAESIKKQVKIKYNGK